MDPKNLLVYDLGGGSFDASLVTVHNTSIKVIKNIIIPIVYYFMYTMIKRKNCPDRNKFNYQPYKEWQSTLGLDLVQVNSSLGQI